MSGVLLTAASIGSTVLLAAISGMFAWMLKLDNRIFMMSSAMVSRDDLADQLSSVIQELRASEARLERLLSGHKPTERS